ncbi:MAG: HlyC/CorC family transporter [Janthinobacterium lividum]
MDISLFASALLIIGLITLSGVLSATETGMLSSSLGKLHRLSKSGDVRAVLAKKLCHSMKKVLGSLLLVNILVNNLATSLTADIFIREFGENGVFYATSVMTILIVTYAEVLPKLLALNNPEKMTLKFVRIIHYIVKIFSPGARLLQAAAEGSLRIIGIDYDPHARKNSSLEELRGAIDLHNPHDLEAVEERAMLHSILDLGDVEVGEVMIHRRNVQMIDMTLPLDEIIDQVISSPYTRIPLWRDNKDNIVGILHAKALLRALNSAQKTSQPIDILALTSKPWFIPESTTLQEQLEMFRRRKEHFAMVVDEYGALQGVVTLEDILEEIVGEISDETDEPLEGVWQGRDGSVVSVGTTTLRDLNRKFQWELPDEEAATIAGLILHEAQIIPEIGQIFVIHGFRLRVLRRVRNQLTLIRIVPPKVKNNDHH